MGDGTWFGSGTHSAALPLMVGSQLHGYTMPVRSSPLARSRIWSTSGNVCMRMIVHFPRELSPVVPGLRHRGQLLSASPLATVAFVGQCIGDSRCVFAFFATGDVQ